MQYIDSHCHLDRLFKKQRWTRSLEEYARTHPQPFPRGYRGTISVWCDPETHQMADRLLEGQENVWAAFGVHPTKAPLWSPQVALRIESYLDTFPQAVAWGEMGLDYHGHRGPYSPPLQRSVFRAQLMRASRRNIPVVIHCRDAEEDLLSVMREILPHDYAIHYHCVTVGPSTIQPFVEYFTNMKFGFTGLLNDPRRGGPARDAVRRLPLHRILAETDAPYFCPPSLNSPSLPSRWRGSSHPGSISGVVATIAHLKDYPLRELATRIVLNTASLYRLALPPLPRILEERE